MNLSEQTHFASKASQLLSWGHWFTFANIGLALLLSIPFMLAEPAPTTFLGGLYLMVTWLGHTSFLTFLCFVLSIFPLSLVFPYPKHIRGMAAVIATLGASLLALDAYVYYQLGYHINRSELGAIIALLWDSVLTSPSQFIIISVCLAALILTFELVAGNYAWHHLNQLKQKSFAKVATGFFVACFITSHSLHIWADATFKLDITKQDNMFPLSYPTTAKSLLAKNGLLDLAQYQQEKEAKLSTEQVTFASPTDIPRCTLTPKNSVDILLFSSDSARAAWQTSQSMAFYPVGSLLLPSNQDDAVFNIKTGLPSYYRASFEAKQVTPLWAQGSLALNEHKAAQTEAAQDEALKQSAAVNLVYMAQVSYTPRPQNHVFLVTLPSQPSGALQVNQLVTTSTLYSNDQSLKHAQSLIQGQDILYTAFSQYWPCAHLASSTMIANDLTQSSDSGVNFTENTIIAYKKDRITLIASDGSYQTISAAKGFQIEQKLDMPFLIAQLKELTRFNKK